MDDSATLRAFLAERDAPCPACGYNLRGIEEPLCPECGGTVELAIGRRSSAAWVLLMAILSVVALSAGMDAARAGRQALLESRPSQTISFGGGSGSLRFTTSFSQTITINGSSIRTFSSPGAVTRSSSGP